MACERYEDGLSDVAGGAAASAELEAHLACCADCRAELGALRGALAIADEELGRLRLEHPSPRLQARIRAAAADDVAPRADVLRSWGPALAAAAVVLIGLAVLLRAPGRRVSVAVGTRSPAPALDARPRSSAAATPEPPIPEPGRPQPPSGRQGQAFAGSTGGTSPEGGASVATRRGARGPQRPATAGPRLGPAEQEVLVPPGEAEALLRFAASLQQRSVPADSLLVADLSAPLAEPRSLHIRPLEIVPLDPEAEAEAETVPGDVE